MFFLSSNLMVQLLFQTTYLTMTMTCIGTWTPSCLILKENSIINTSLSSLFVWKALWTLGTFKVLGNTQQDYFHWGGGGFPKHSSHKQRGKLSIFFPFDCVWWVLLYIILRKTCGRGDWNSCGRGIESSWGKGL